MGVYVAEPRIEIGRKVVELLDQERFIVKAALWLFVPDAGEWRLVIATSLVDREGPKKAYSELQKILSRVNIEIDLRQISLVGLSDPLIKLLKSAVRTGKEISGIRFTQNVINSVLIEDAYIYRLL